MCREPHMRGPICEVTQLLRKRWAYLRRAYRWRNTVPDEKFGI